MSGPERTKDSNMRRKNMDEQLTQGQQKIEQAPSDDPEEWRRRGDVYKQHAAELERFLLMRRTQGRGLKLVESTSEEQETGPAEDGGPGETP